MSMNNRNVITTILSTFVSVGASVCVASDFTIENHGIATEVNGNEISLQFYTPSTVRVIKNSVGTKVEKQSLSVVSTPGNVKFNTRQSGKYITVKSDSITVTIDTASGKISFLSPDGKKLLREGDNVSFTPVDDAGEASFKVRQDFCLDADEPIYGFGNLENGRLSQRGLKRTLMPGNIEDGIPVFVSVKGYGVYWDNYSPTTFVDDKDVSYFESEVGDCVDYYFMYGKNADGVIGEMRRLSGEVPMFPLWTYGFWQSRERYKSQDEIVEVVNKYRALGVPLDGIIQDWQYWGNNYLWNAMEFMNPEFNNAQKMVDDIHANNAKVIISIWSSFGPSTRPYKELDSKNMLFDFSTWPQSGIAEQWPPRMDYPSGVRVYDAYHPEARDIYWNHLKRLYDHDMDGWWMDSTEPDHLDFKAEDMDTKTYLGSFRKVRCAYPLLTVGGVYDHQRKESDRKRVFILTRSGFFGQQRYGCNVWTGDVASTWETLRNQIPALLNFTLTGNPNSNSDIGGFFAGAYNKSYGDNSAVKNPQFQELFVRWMQFGAFTPMMRSHGADIKREIYYFGNRGETVFDAVEDAIKLRYSLLPYIYSTSWDVSRHNSSFMRPLMMDFPKDRNGWDCGDQFMFGRNILVAPVVKANYTSEKIIDIDENTGWNRQENAGNDAVAEMDFMTPVNTDIYLPAGTSWWDFETNEIHKGGKKIVKPTTIKTLPLFVKAGSILPIGPDVQYATEKSWDDLEIRVYPGADGEFTLYEDEFDNYNYEKGSYSTIGFSWNDKTRTLTVADRQGEYQGMLSNRTFKVVVADKKSKIVNVSYNGSVTTVKL